jgi:hypothetical protein
MNFVTPCPCPFPDFSGGSCCKRRACNLRCVAALDGDVISLLRCQLEILRLTIRRGLERAGALDPSCLASF